MGPGGFDEELNECLDFLNDMGFYLPSLLVNRDKFSAEKMFLKVADEVIDNVVEKAIEEVGGKLISQILGIFGHVQYAIDLIHVFACVNRTWGVGSLQKSLEAYGIMLYSKIMMREEIIDYILKECSCAFDPPAPSDSSLPLPEDIELI